MKADVCVCVCVCVLYTYRCNIYHDPQDSLSLSVPILLCLLNVSQTVREPTDFSITEKYTPYGSRPNHTLTD